MKDRMQHVLSLTAFEAEYRKQGIVAGMDEVGRGPLAGPVLAACVVIPADHPILWVDDSKKLSESRREKVYEEICAAAAYIGIGEVSPGEIDRMNILQATKKAMNQAAAGIPADLFLVDAVTGLELPGRQIAIIRGDAQAYSIAAASIVAKVVRDRQMAELDRLYPEYGFIRNKGYGTKEHIDAILRCGPCPEHRRSFIGKWI